MGEAHDAVVIGSGHNGLVAAAYIARAGLDVLVLERNDVAGGAVASEELTEPGFVHDTFSSWHPLFKLSAAFAELGGELAIDYAETPEETTANVRSDGRALVAYRDPAQTAESLTPRDRGAYLREIERFGAVIGTAGRLLGSELHSPASARLVTQLALQLRRRGALAFAADVVSSARAWFETRFSDGEVGELYAPWALHVGLPPDAAGSGFQVLAIAGSLHAVGLPVVRGGASGFVRAFERLIGERGGSVATGVEAAQIATRMGRAVAVIAGDERYEARRAVIANTTPTQLYERLLAPGAVPVATTEQARRFRYSPRAGMQIHVALAAPLRWRDSRLDRVPIVHLSDGPAHVSLACAQAAAGLLPAEPTVVVGQPALVDPSRAPAGAGLLWIQLQQVPYAPRGDAAGEIAVGEAGWHEEALVGAYTERVLARLAPHVENWPEVRRATAALSPVELERRNPNLVRGDIYAGDCELSQSYLWRPLASYGSHATPVAGLYHCGASTHPGPGLNAASGRIVGLACAAPSARRMAGLRGPSGRPSAAQSP
jgi:phytoene dehydrogenase-like protein